MKLPICIYGDPVLRKTAVDITPDYPELPKLIADMFETLTYADGVGLAAPQIGLSIRVVVIDLTELADDYPEYKDFKKTYINAHILETSEDKVSMEEGCLSIPGIHEKVSRPKRVKVRYMDENFTEHEEWADGFLARVMYSSCRSGLLPSGIRISQKYSCKTRNNSSCKIRCLAKNKSSFFFQASY